MAVYSIFSGTADGYSYSTGTTAAAAHAGTGYQLEQSTGEAQTYAGGYVPGDIQWLQSYLGFDTSGVSGTPISVRLFLYHYALTTTDAYTIQVKAYDWGGTVDDGDWQDTSEFGALTTIASLASASWSTAGYNHLPENGTEFVDALNLSGTTYIVIDTSRHASGSTPSGNEYVGFRSADQTGTSNDPFIEVVTESTGPVVIDTTETLVGSSDSTPTFNMPAVRPDGDLFIVFAFCDGNMDADLLTSVGNWVAGPQANALNNVSAQAWYALGSSEAASYTGDNGGAGEEWVFEVTRVAAGTYDDTDVIDVSDVGSSTSNEAAAVAPTVTPTVDNGRVFRAWSVDTDAPTYSTGPTGHTRLGSSSSSAGGAGSVYGGAATDDTLTTASAAEGTVTMPGTYSDAWAALTLVVNPPAAAATNATITGTAATATAAGLTGTVTALVSTSITGTAAAATGVGLDGSAATVNIAAISGEAGAATSAGVAGTVAAIRIVAVTGEAATATAAGVDGTVTAHVQVDVSGEAATGTAVGLTGSVTAVGIVAVSGEVATATAAGLDGAVSVVVNASVSGETATATAAGQTGTVAAIGIVAVSGEAATATASGLEGTVATGVLVTIAGATATASVAGVPGTVTSIGIVAVTGTAAAATAAGLTGTVAAIRIVAVAGEAAAATAVGLAGTATSVGIVTISGAAGAATAAALSGTVDTAVSEAPGTVVLSEGAGVGVSLSEGAGVGVALSEGAASSVALSEGTGVGVALSVGGRSSVEVS